MVLNLRHRIVSKVERMSTRSWRMVEINARAHKHLNIERKPITITFADPNERRQISSFDPWL